MLKVVVVDEMGLLLGMPDVTVHRSCLKEERII